MDVSVLHYLILQNELGIDLSSLSQSDALRYHHDPQTAIDRVDSGEFTLAFLVNPAPAGEVEAIAKQLERMPPKTTFFYPKLYSGLLMNLLESPWASAIATERSQSTLDDK